MLNNDCFAVSSFYRTNRLRYFIPVLCAFSLPCLVSAEDADNKTFYDLFSNCLSYPTNHATLSTDGLKPLKADIANKVAPDSEEVYHKPKGAFNFPRANWGYFIHKLGDHGCRVFSAPVNTGKAQGHVWEETRQQEFTTLGTEEDKENNIITHRYEKKLEDGRSVRVIAVSYGAFKRTIDVRAEVS